jgi:polysaccharide chain length determinant protein (PEP-CTERM system associated)
MQPAESVSTPRRTMDVEDYIDILRRHKGWILGPAFLGLVVGFVVAFLWPNTYVSMATIRVVPPQVPENLVQTNLNLDMTNHVLAMAQTIMSRSNLTSIILSNHLYPNLLAREPLEDVIEEMQKNDVAIGAVQNTESSNRGQVTAFQISFKYYDRYMAQKVTETLVSHFLTENERDRQQASTSTTQFLSDQTNEAKKKLDATEQKLSEFRMKNMGRLPDEVQGNMQELNALQVSMNNADAAISRIMQEKLLLENSLRIAKEQLESAKENNPEHQVATMQRSQQLEQAERDVAQLEENLTILRQRYKDTHPDVQRVMGLLAAAKTQRDNLIRDQVQKKTPDAKAPVAETPEAKNLEVAVQRIEAEIAARDLDLRDHQKEMNRLNDAIKAYQSRIEGVPIGEKEYGDLIAERNMARTEYEDLSNRVNISQRATDLENRKQGETLELLDAASLPTTPTEPKRPIYITVATTIGLVLGLALAGAREVKDTSLKNLKDVRAYTKLPVLGSIPLLENDLVVRRRRRLAWLGWSTAALIGVAIICSSVVYYYAIKA